MNNFIAIDHFDTLDVLGTLQKKNPKLWLPVEARGETNNEMIGLGASLLLRAHDDITLENWLDDLPVQDQHELHQWPSMIWLLDKAKESIMVTDLAKALLSGEMARAMISRLDPGSSIFWHTDDGPYHQRTARFHLPLVTNPLCFMYSQHEMVHMAQGVLYWFNNHVRHSAANWGKTIRCHLIFEMYKK